jgi:hypothetical protein
MDSNALSNDGKAVAQKVMENAKQQARAQLGSSGQRTQTVSALYRQWGEEHRKNECAVAEHPIKRQMVGCAWSRARPENPRHNERLDHHNRASIRRNRLMADGR